MPAPKGNKNAVGNKGGGRTSRYRPEYASMAKAIAPLGATDADFAAIFGVSETTINAWKRKHVEFSEALKKAKTEADAEVERSLFQRAMGYSHPEDKIFQHDGAPLVVPTTKHYPPDTTACIFWLKNRQPERWRDKHDYEHEVKGGVMQVPVAPDPEAWARAAAEYQRQLMHDSSGAANGEAKPNGHA